MLQSQNTVGFRLSPRQRRLWLSQRSSTACRAQCVIRLDGDLRKEVLRQAVQDVIDRHEILRTTFHLPAGLDVPLQVISDASIPSWEHRDLTRSSAEKQENEIEKLLRLEARLPWSFEAAPLSRVTLLTLGKDRHALLLCLPSLCADAKTLKNVLHEISRAYAARLEGEEIGSEPLQYADFSAWQEQLLKDETEDAVLGKEYWRKQSFSSVPRAALPFERRGGGARREFGPKSLVLKISPSLSQQIDGVVEKYQASTADFLLACWQTLIWRISRRPEFIVAVAFDGRKLEDLDEALGLFAQTIPIRGRFDDDCAFSTILSHAADAIREAYSWQEYYNGEASVGSVDGDALLPIAFEFEEWPSKYSSAGISFAVDKAYVCGERFKLKLCCARIRGCLTAELHYDPEYFPVGDIERLAEQFGVLLQSAAEKPESPVGTLKILSDAERQLLAAFKNTGNRNVGQQCVHQLFEAQVDQTADEIAVAYEDQRLTYRELNSRANQLAHYLKRLGVQPETFVGLCVERSLDMIIGMLGILKAGGAYVPLDPVLPKDRLGFMLDDSRVSMLLTQECLLDKLPAHRARVICLDRNWQDIARGSEDNTHAGALSDNAVYVLYTSGSTGKPKGVVVEHRQLLNYINGILPRLDLPKGTSFAALSTIAADLGNTAIFPSLCTGGCLHIVSHERASSPDALGDYFALHPIDCLKIVPSHLAALLTGGRPERILPRKRLVLGGESANWHLIRKIQALAPDCVILNHYGPTECTIGITTYRVENDQDHQSLASVPIGQPIANAEVFILDKALRQVPIWFSGELCIGGDSLSRGYLNGLELSAEKFIPHPFSIEPGARLYKTGDLARYLPDGNIELLGRVDNQVKIRGFRVELGEIEAVLSQHPGVWKSAVIALDDGPGDRQLAAYIVAATRPPPTIGELRSFLQQKLPEYMIPSAVAYLELLPLSPNGKLDRKALPPLEKIRREATSTFAPPTTPVEEKLARIWSEILKLERVGIYDNFFELGGHSLLAILVISRVRQAFNIELPLRCLFETPTVSGLAERIERGRGEEQGLQTPPLLPIPRNGALPLSFAQQRLWFLNQFEPGSSVYNIHIALRLCGQLNIAALEQSLDKIQRRHEAIRTSFVAVDGRPLQVIAPPSTLKLPVIDLRGIPETGREAEAQRLGTEEGRRPFDLTQSPLWRVALLQLREHEHILLITLHHIVGDGWSKGVIYRELAALYQDFSTGQSPRLPELPIQYADYAHWQRQWLQGKALDIQLSYWKKQLEHVPAVLNLPTDRPRPAVQSFRGARQSLELSKELTQGLKALSRKEGVTLFMTLLAAFQTLLYRCTGQEDIVVGSPIANRNRTEIEGLIGFFINTLVLRSDLSGNPTLRELLGRVRETALGAYAHQDLPFEKLVEELHPERSLSHSPLFQVFFNMFNQGDSKLDLFGITAEPFSSSNPESKFDLTLYVREQNDEISFNLVYRVDLFSQARMTCFLQQYRYLLEQIVAAPEKPIRSYSLVAPESRLLLPDPCAVLSEPSQQLVTSIFTSWARQTPKQPAVSQGEQTWSYSELAERADTLARVLTASGLERGDVVAVYGRRSFGVIAGVIGTLLSGGILLLLDYDLPSQRKQLMLREARAKKILYVGDKQPDDAWLEEDFTPDVLFVDRAKGCAVDAEMGQNLETISLPELSPDEAAYIFFTSGTTGVPKGVLGCHKSLSHFLKWQRETFTIGPQDRSAQLTSLSFDVVLRDIFLPLTSGGTLCLPEVVDTLGPDDIIAWLERERISVLHTGPTLAQSWLASGAGGASLRAMRCVFFAGEPLTETLVRRWRAAFPSSGELVNLYGPTETTLAKCFYRVPSEISYGVQPVGWPLPETQALVLAENNQLCGINEPGEIVLRTPFRSLGYVNAPQENQKRFVKNPFRDDAQDLIYFTGDTGRYRPDGTLEILGRLDDQVKIRGVRVEPAEVTAILAHHPAVESNFVVAMKNEQDETCLVAYVVASKQEKTTSTQLRSYLVEQLPAAMIPAFFVFLDSLPLTFNGKVDRRALPVPDQSRPELESPFVAPRTAVEDVLAHIWTDVLKLDKVGIHDNFFELGGHSLLATQVVSRVRHVFQMELPLRTMFEKQTVEELAMVIAKIQVEKTEGDAVANILADIESLSDEEVEELVAKETVRIRNSRAG